ncbi:MAG: VOC family protein [Calditrichia bacterium]
MENGTKNYRIDYIEFTTVNVQTVKHFYQKVFEWEFTDYGPDYTSFHDGRLSGGFRTGNASAENNILIVLYASDLESIKEKITAAGGTITRDIFEFPGGRRFHFRDPAGMELAVWSE